MIFVAATSGSQLKNRYIEEIESGLQDQSSRAGVTIKQMLQRSDPVREKECNNINCLVFSTGGKGPCRSTGVTYELVCQPCRQKYIGETSRSAYTRGKEHPAASSGTEGAKFGDVETIGEFILGT